MKLIDWCLLAVIAAAAVLALRSIFRSRKDGKGCNGCCASCGHHCGG